VFSKYNQIKKRRKPRRRLAALFIVAQAADLPEKFLKLILMAEHIRWRSCGPATRCGRVYAGPSPFSIARPRRRHPLRGSCVIGV